MRKNCKKKKRSCKLCKPHKMGIEKRWKAREMEKLKELDREIQQYTEEYEEWDYLTS